MASKYQDRRIWMNTGAQAKLKNLALEEKTVERTHAIYRQAAKDIEKEVSEIYLQLGAQSDSGRWEFKGLRHPATRKDITALISAVEKAGLMDFVPEKLSNRMSVLQVKQANIWLKLNEAGKSAHTATKENLLRTMQNSAALWKKAAGAGAESFIGFDRNVCGYMMGMNWADGNFSSRLWNTTQETWEKVRDELGRALANGQPMETTKKRIKQMLTEAHNPNAKGSGGIDYDVERIVRTENAKASTQADMVRWREMGVTKLQWHASFEKNTCEHCADRDGRIYDIKRIMDEPPLHPNCRCYFAAYDETNAQFPDTTYYKDEQGDYEEIQWAPYRSVIDEKGQLRSKALPVSDYFWNTSPWTIYRPEKTNLEYEGEIDDMVVDAVERTYTELTDEFPELAERVDSWYDNRITLHRGDSVINGNKLEKIGGLADIEKHQITITYPDGRKGGNMLSQMAEQAQAQYDKHFWSTPKANHTIKHELAHVLSDELKSRGVSTDDIIKYATGTKNARKALKIMKEEISDYADKNMNEAFSETYARAYSQDPTLQNDITARFSDGLRTALNKPKRVTKISVDKATPAKVSEDGVLPLTDYKSWVNSLTEEELAAVDNYKRGHTIMSKVRRQTREDIYWLDNTEYAKELRASKNLEKAIDKFTLEKEQIVWRGIRSDSRPDTSGRQTDPQSIEFVKQLKDIKVGQTFKDAGFSSTSIDKDIAIGRIFSNDASVLVKIKLPAGKGIAAQLDDFTIPENRYSERELLLNANTKFKVTGRKTVTITNPYDVTAKREITQLELEVVRKPKIVKK